MLDQHNVGNRLLVETRRGSREHLPQNGCSFSGKVLKGLFEGNLEQETLHNLLLVAVERWSERLFLCIPFFGVIA